MQITIRDMIILPEALDADMQKAVLDDVRAIVRQAPLFHPETARGQKMSVRMTSAGALGWVSDRSGYRYDPVHPNGTAWPPIPPRILSIWHDLTGLSRAPDSCLCNYYGEGARMGLHQDKDEADFSWPVLSLSLGDDGLFRIGNETRGGKTESIWLKSGAAVIMGNAARLTYHGVDRIRFGSSRLLPKGGRLNITLRVVT